MGEGRIHTFEPDVDNCQTCHADLEDFDRNGVQTEVEAMLEELHELLVAEGLLTEEGHPVVGLYPEAQAWALWNYIFVAEEDGSLGVHNSKYTIDLLEASIAAFE